MRSSRMESLFFGESGEKTWKRLVFGGALFVVIAVLSLVFELSLEGVVASWPKRTGFERVDIGGISVVVSDIFLGIYAVLLTLSISIAFVSARRNEGLLVSVFLGSVPLVGYSVGSTIYYGKFTEFGYEIEPIPYFLLYGITAGLFGFALGRLQR